MPYLPVLKPLSAVEEYITLCMSEQPKVIFELGIRGGGSTALLNELAEPSKLIAIEIDPRPVKMLDDPHRAERQPQPGASLLRGRPIRSCSPCGDRGH